MIGLSGCELEGVSVTILDPRAHNKLDQCEYLRCSRTPSTLGKEVKAIILLPKHGAFSSENVTQKDDDSTSWKSRGATI